MKWILVAVSISAYAHRSISFQEFDDLKACQFAIEKISMMTDESQMRCVPKGEQK